MRRLAADLHIHTALSPCASDEMTPPAIVRAAIDRGLAMIAICDHNSAGNVAAVQEAAGSGLAVIAGIEVTTSEEVHVTGLFPHARAAGAAGQAVCASLPDVTDTAYRNLGEQLLMDARARVLGSETKMLAAASGLGLSEVVQVIKSHDGLAIAAHFDRPSFSVLSQLGVFPLGAGFDAIEVSVAASSTRGSEFASFDLPALAASDAHFLPDVGARSTLFEVSSPSFEELALALQRSGGRRIYHA